MAAGLTDASRKKNNCPDTTSPLHYLLLIVSGRDNGDGPASMVINYRLIVQYKILKIKVDNEKMINAETIHD